MFLGKKPTNKNLVFVYGSARKGMFNHSFFEGAVKFKTKAVLKGFKMYVYSMGSYPAVIKSDNSNNIIVGEVYQFTDVKKLAIYDNMEIVAGFKRIYTKVESEKGKEIDIVFYEFGYPELLKNNRVVDSGDWVEFVRHRTERLVRDTNARKENN